MKNIKKLVAAVSICIFAIGAVGCNMIEKTPEAIAKTVIAKVGDKKITKGDLDKNPQMVALDKQLKTQYGEKYAENEELKEELKEKKLGFLKQMTIEEVILQQAEKLKVVPKEAELNKEIQSKIDEYKKSQNITDDKTFESLLQQSGVTLDQVKASFKTQVLYEKVYAAITKSVTATDKEAQDYYNKFKDKYPVKEDDPTTLHLAHILVATEDEAKSIKAKLDKGEDFATLAKQYGTDGTKENGGDLGTIKTVKSGFDEDFMEGAMLLKDGEISSPVKTQYGYHIIKLIKKVSKPVKTFDKAKTQAKADVVEKKKNDTWTKKFKEMQDNNIKIYEDKLM